jgi:hypothetical protein
MYRTWASDGKYAREQLRASGRHAVACQGREKAKATAARQVTGLPILERGQAVVAEIAVSSPDPNASESVGTPERLSV